MEAGGLQDLERANVATACARSGVDCSQLVERATKFKHFPGAVAIGENGFPEQTVVSMRQGPGENSIITSQRFVLFAVQYENNNR